MAFKPAAASLDRYDGITQVISNQDNGDAAAALAAAETKVRTLFNIPPGYLVFDADLGTPNGAGPLKDAGDTRIYFSDADYVDVQG
jgi:hypothetical protein